MDNLFNLQNLFTALHIAEALAHGVAHTIGHGVPPSIIQKEEKNKDRTEKLRGTPNLFAVSVYDTKPVHILSTAAKFVEWLVKEKEVWSDRIKKKAMMKYLRLNDGHRRPTPWQLSAGPVDETTKMVVGVLHFVNWCCRCKCLQNLRGTV